MLIFYTPEYGFSWLPTLLGVPEIKAVHDEHGDVGIYYVLAFGHPASHHKNEFDFNERDRKVLDEIGFRKMGGGRNKDKFVAKFFESDLCANAIDAANRCNCLPNVVYLDQLRNKEKAYLSTLDKGVWVADPEKRAKELQADKATFELLARVRAEQRVEEAFILKMVSGTGMMSLDQFFDQ